MSAEFLAMHSSGTFVLINVHDAGFAAIAQAAGAVALGTTSSGHAYTLARPDAAGALHRDEAIERVAQICAAVTVPVSVDAENGWGAAPEDVADTIRLLAEIGAAGASIEDWSGDPDIGFYDRAHAAERVAAAVEAALSLPSPFVICARVEAFLHGTAEPLRESIFRLQAFAAVGADCLYAPGPNDLATLRTIVSEAGGPVNALLGIGSTITAPRQRTFQRLVTDIVTTGNFATDLAPLTDADITATFSLTRRKHPE